MTTAAYMTKIIKRKKSYVSYLHQVAHNNVISLNCTLCLVLSFRYSTCKMSTPTHSTQFCFTTSHTKSIQNGAASNITISFHSSHVSGNELLQVLQSCGFFVPKLITLTAAKAVIPTYVINYIISRRNRFE